MSILGLVPQPAGRIVGGHIHFGGRDLVALTEREMRSIRGNEISMIFQEPMTSLNPVLTIGQQIAEPLMIHRRLSRRAAFEQAGEMLRLVRISDVSRRLLEYPHQLSGGMRQRAMIAMALACGPKVLLADEPTTALDVTIQAQIIELMIELQERTGTAIVFITHDLGIIAETARRVVVMYAGRIVEQADVKALFEQPFHPYSAGLLRSMPRVAPTEVPAGRRHLTEIPGMVPALDDLPSGCRFAARCAFATEQCRRADPPLKEHAPGRWAACWHTDRTRADFDA